MPDLTLTREPIHEYGWDWSGGPPFAAPSCAPLRRRRHASIQPPRGGDVAMKSQARRSDAELGRDVACGDCIGESLMVALVLIGVCRGEAGDRPVEGIALPEIG